MDRRRGQFSPLLFFLLFWIPVSGQESGLDGSYDYNKDTALFRQFETESFENVERFKTSIVQLLMRQNLFLNAVQSKIHSHNFQEEFKFLITTPVDEVQFANELHVSYPMPNLRKPFPNNASQLAVSVSDDHSLKLWSVSGGQRVQFLDSFPLRIHPEDYTAVKVISFVQNRVPDTWINTRRADFRLVVVTLWKWNRQSIVGEQGRVLITDDMITVHVFNGYLSPEGLIGSLKPLKMASNSIQAEQIIKLDIISDFDIVPEVGVDSGQFWYLSVIQSNEESNAKFQLDLFKLKESKFDRIASLQTNEMINAHRVKMAMFNSQLYLICTYDRSSQDFKYYPIVSVYKHVETFEENFLRHESSLRNESQISRIESIHHLPGKDLIFMRQEQSILVYWFNGNSFVFFTEIHAIPDPGSSLGTIQSFTLSEMPGSKPFLVTGYDSNSLVIHYQIYDSFHSSPILLKNIPEGYAIVKIEAFFWNMEYYLLLSFQEVISGYSASPEVRRFSQLRRVVLQTPESNDEIRTYEFCQEDLLRRIDRGIAHVQKLEKKSQQLLRITPERPEIDVDVIVEENFITEQALPEVKLAVDPNTYLAGADVQSLARQVKDRLISRSQFIDNQVALLDRPAQVFTSPLLFHAPLTAQHLKIGQSSGDFRLNNAPFDLYLNNTLTVAGDQTLEYQSPAVFEHGLNVENLQVHHLNHVDMSTAIDIRSRDSVRIHGRHHFRELSLHNGTSAPLLNNVPLAHVFQDRSEASDYFHGRKRFRSISTQALKVDQTFNGFSLPATYEDLIWLRNEHLDGQALNGSLLHFLGDVSANRTFIDGKINGLLEPEMLAKVALRTNEESEILGSVTIENSAFSPQNVQFRGLLNGEIDLHKDVILLNGDQHFRDGQVTFESKTHFAGNLDFRSMNDRFQREDILTRQEVANPENSRNLFRPLISNKKFLRDVNVDGNVDIKDFSTVNGFDISEMFKQLDTVSSINTPVFVKNLEVRGDARSRDYNGIPADDLARVMHSRLRKLAPQTIAGPFRYVNSEIGVKNLRFNTTKSGIRFPNDFVSKSDEKTVKEPVDFFGEKFFESPIDFRDVSTHKPDGLINGYDIAEFFNSLLNETSGPEVITGKKKFVNLYIEGDVNLETGVINDNFIDKVVLLDVDRNISQSLHFNDVRISSKNLYLDRLFLKNFVNDYHVPELMEDLVHYEKGSVLEMRNKHFPSLKLENLFTKPDVPVMGVDLAALMKDSILIDEEGTVESPLVFMDAKFEQVTDFRDVNGFPKDYFRSAILKTDKPVVITGEKIFFRDISAGSLGIKSASINGKNLTDLMTNSLIKMADQEFLEKPVFLGTLGLKDLQLDPELRLGKHLLKNYVKLNEPEIHIFSQAVFEHLNSISGDLFVSGMLNNYDITKIAENAVFMSPDLSYILKFERLPKLHITENLRLPEVLNGQQNRLKSIVRVADLRPFDGDIIFANNVIVKNLEMTQCNDVNVTFLLNDIVFDHLEQSISGSKNFRKPLKFIGDLRMDNKNILDSKQVFVHSGMVNEVNITHLFLTTVTTEDQDVIFGPKQFSGRIRFNGPIHSPAGLNGGRVPEDFYLTFTNETISGEVTFARKVSMAGDLNARLINRVNLTEFTGNAIFIEPSIYMQNGRMGILNSQDISTILHFQDAVYVKNLTIRDEINDIEIGELISENQPNVRVSGLKQFDHKVRPVMVKGHLQVKTINRQDFDKDLKGDWIDTRSDEPIRIDGTLRLREPTNVKRLKIGAKINNFRVDQISGEFFQRLDAQIQRLNQSIGQEIKNFDRIGRNLETNVQTEFLFDIRFLVQIQSFQSPILAFNPSSFLVNNQLMTHLSPVEDHRSQLNSTHECFNYQSGLLSPSSPTRFVPEMIPTFGGDSAAHFNLKTIFSSSINLPHEKFLLQSTFSSGPLCQSRNVLNRNRPRISHHLSFFEGRFLPEMALNLGYFNETIAEIHKVRVFTMDRANKFLAVLFRDPQTFVTRFQVFRIDLSAQAIILVQELPNAHILDFDLTLYDGRFILTTAYKRLGEGSQSSVLQWSPRGFQPLPTKIDQFLHGADYRYQKTAFLETPYGLFIVYSTVGRQPRDCSTFGLPEENYADIWHMTGSGAIEHYQRLSLGTGRLTGRAGNELAMATFSKMVYLFVSTGRDRVAIFRREGASRFQHWRSIAIPDLSTMDVFWHSKSLYVALGSARDGQSRILKAVISGASQSMKLFEQSMLESLTLDSVSSSYGAKLREG